MRPQLPGIADQGPFGPGSSFTVIASCSTHGGLGAGGCIPWGDCVVDARHVARTTAFHPDPFLTNAVVMGYNTWRQLGRRPLKWRINVVLAHETSSAEPCDAPEARDEEEVVAAPTLDAALARLEARGDVGGVFVIGGHRTLNLALHHPRCERALLSVVDHRGSCDCYLDVNHLEAGYELRAHTPMLAAGGWHVYFAEFARRRAVA